MIQLIQGMYADLKCNTFGLSYGQNRLNDVIRNAGWFNHRGEKLGFGDLNLADIDNIAADIPDNELFIILNEGNTTWNIPSDLDRFTPGLDYVMNNASWIISGFKATQYNAYAVKESVKIGITTYYDNAHKIVHNNGVDYYEITKDMVFKSLGYVPGGFIEVAKTLNIVHEPGSYYGMDVYKYPEGKYWAVGNAEVACLAAKEKVKEEIHLVDLKKLRNYIPFTFRDIQMLENLTDKYGSESSHLFKAMLGSNLNDFAEDELGRRGCAAILANYDGMECYSDNIEGLPKDLYAYRID